MTDLSGRRAVVTGASRGIGAAIADALAARGAQVVRVSRSGDQLPDGVACDITSADAVREASQSIAAGAPPDILVNNAGSFLLESLENTAPEDLVAQVNANLVGPFRFIHAILPIMKTPARLVTIGSVVDYQVFPGNGAYAAAKHGLRALHEVLALEQRGRLQCTLISPGATDTELWDPVNPDARDDLPDRAGMLRPSDVADAVVYAVTRPPHVVLDVIRMGAA